MSNRFNAAGIPGRAVSGATSVSITWRLRHGMPVDTFRVASVVA